MAKKNDSTLLFFFQPDCEICAGIKKDVLPGFKRAFPKTKVIQIDTTEEDLSGMPVQIPDTLPAFMLLRPGQKPKTLTGQGVDEKYGDPVTLGQLMGWASR
jgi:hypothetical protein